MEHPVDEAQLTECLTLSELNSLFQELDMKIVDPFEPFFKQFYENGGDKIELIQALKFTGHETLAQR